MKPSNEQIAEWAREHYASLSRDSLVQYIARKAYTSGRESMRQKAAEICAITAARHRDEMQGTFAGVAEGLERDIRNLPISGGGND